MSTISPFAYGVPTYSTGFGPTSSPGGFSNQSFGAPGLLSFGYPIPGIDPFFSNSGAAISGNLNRLLGYANGSAVNINFGPIPSTLGFGGLLLGSSFYGGSGVPGGGTFGSALTPQFASQSAGNSSGQSMVGQLQNQGSQSQGQGQGQGQVDVASYLQQQQAVIQALQQQILQLQGGGQQQGQQQQYGGYQQQPVGYGQQPQYAGYAQQQQQQYPAYAQQQYSQPQYAVPQYASGYPQQSQYGGATQGYAQPSQYSQYGY